VSFFSSNPATELFLPTRPEEKTSAASWEVEQQVLSLFDSQRNRLLRYAISFGLPVHDGEDVLQEVFLALFRHLQQGRSRENLLGWVFRVTHHLALKRRAMNQSNLRVCVVEGEEVMDYPDPAAGPEEQLLFSERQQRLLAVMRALPESDRHCLQLRAEGYRYREISGILGISLGSVSNSLTRTIARMERMDKR
jgi:RNA polymerase sigma-70 factor, ECF subfamily